MPGQSPQREPAAGKAPTGQRTVHCDLRCLSCEFVAEDHSAALQEAREHNQATGHDLEGDHCCFMPAGNKAARKPEQQLRDTLPFFSEPWEAAPGARRTAEQAPTELKAKEFQQ